MGNAMIIDATLFGITKGTWPTYWPAGWISGEFEADRDA
jgi:hypothetical protein